MGLLSRARELFVGRRREALERAAHEEALGNVDAAVALYVEAGAHDEAARILALSADSAFDPEKRYTLLGRAARLAEGDEKKALELRRARLAVDLVRAGTLRLGKSELADLAERLGKLGDPSVAAEVFRLAGDAEAEARMLVEAGAIERLENVLDAEESRDRKARERAELAMRVRDLASSGRRREAIGLGAAARDDDPRVADVLREIESRRAEGPRITLELDGAALDVVFGERVVIGRAGASVVVASPAISREHLALRRGPTGPEAVDLGSRNGTLLGGARLDVPVAVGTGLTLLLGGEVELRLSPWGEGGVRLELADRVVLAPLGPLTHAGFRVAPASDGWLELESEGPAFLAGMAVGGRVELCRGDAFASERDGAVRLRIP